MGTSSNSGDGRGDAGITMIELIVTISLAGVLMALGTMGLRSYLIAHRHSATAQDIRSALRAAGEQSLSEGRTYCLYFTATTWTLYRSNCTVAANRVGGTLKVEDASVTLTGVSFPAPASAVPNQTTACPTANSCAYFYPRGTALAGGLQVVRPGKTYTLSVEGLTGRVSLV